MFDALYKHVGCLMSIWFDELTNYRVSDSVPSWAAFAAKNMLNAKLTLPLIFQIICAIYLPSSMNIHYVISL